MNQEPIPEDKITLAVSFNYGLSTFFTFFFELGILLWGLSNFGNILVPLKLLLAFRISHVLSGQVVIKNCLIATLTTLIGSVIFYFTSSVIVFGISVFIIEFGLHSLRENFKAHVIKDKRYWKDIPRAIAFIFAFLFSPVTLLFFSLLTFITILCTRFILDALPKADEKIVVVTEFSKIMIYIPEYLFVFLHHLHFFIYCYFLLFFLKEAYETPNCLLGVMFLVGWIGYFFIDYIIPAKRISAFWGHLLCCICIIAIQYSESFSLTLLLWFLTGVGGGTIFIRSYFKNKEKYSDVICDIWEGAGQSVGILISIILIAFLGYSSLAIFLAAAIAAASSAMYALYISEIIKV